MTMSAGKPSIREPAWGASPFWPAVRMSRTGQPNPRTARWIWCSGRRASVRWHDLQTPFFRPSGVLVSADNGGIDDEILEVWIVRHSLEHPPPDAFSAPPAEPPKHAVPFSERLGQVTPRRACAHDPQNPLDEHSVVASGRTLLVRSTDDQPTNRLPLVIVQHQPIHHTQSTPPKGNLESWIARIGNP